MSFGPIQVWDPGVQPSNALKYQLFKTRICLDLDPKSVNTIHKSKEVVMTIQPKRNQKGWSNFVFIVLSAVMAFIVACSAGAQQTDRPAAPGTVITIEKLKSMDLKKAAAKMTQLEYVVEGYFVADPVPMLVKDLKFVRINTRMPESAYILLRGKGIDRFLDQKTVHGAFIQVKGKLAADEKLVKGKITHVLDCAVLPRIIKKPEITYLPEYLPLCKRHPDFCKFPPFIRTKYALLFSSGINPVNAHRRYWNDLKFMYLTLRSKYGFSDANIVVVYKNGTAEDSDMTVDYAASATGMDSAIKYLRSRMTARDDFFFFVTNHGGGYHDTSCGSTAGSYDGRADSLPGDEIDTYSWDEQVWYYNQTQNDIWDDDIANWINSLDFKKMTAVFEQCFSGGLLRDLRGCNRILISAATEFQFSWGMGPSYQYDTFSYHFTSALNNADESGGALATNPDTDGDGKISILEAFLYAKTNDTDCETPLLEDSGNGVGTNTPSATGSDGKLAANTHL